ncbi:DUF1295-domain-containing protein [Daldinia caldariorum]|uniref:DUF1295-domain-containing protein n=1 Tax=Daldinia caldariorum TaxID=326644 RepID=UPI00200799E0|nr:DUF1295-domain-containing protein [Daldinia caldariorum]KAI1464370.1 DUF1295-domain-containing protein [Daldinia caldariorum]
MADSVHVLNNYYLSITLLVTIAYQLFFFAIAYSLKFDKVTDFAGGTNFVVLAVLTLALSCTPDARQIVASALVAAWGLRLSLFLLYRVTRTGKDDRFDGTRDRFLPFLGFWAFQMLWVWAVSLPLTVLNSPAVRAYQPQALPPFGTGRDIAGAVLFGVGFAVESASDAQRLAFRARNDREAVCDAGFFAWCRHPNYFGEILIHFVGQASNALYATILGPCFLTILLLFVSGLPLSERPGAKKRYEEGLNWDAYRRYLNRTSILIPFPPQIYERVPIFLKRTVFLEFPMYVFDPAKHSDAVQDRRAAEGDDRNSLTNGA